VSERVSDDESVKGGASLREHYVIECSNAWRDRSSDECRKQDVMKSKWHALTTTHTRTTAAF